MGKKSDGEPAKNDEGFTDLEMFNILSGIPKKFVKKAE